MTEEEKKAAEEAARKAKEAEEAEAAKKAAEEEARKKAESGGNEAAEALKKAEDEKAKLLKELMAMKDAKKAAEERAKSFEGLDPEAARKALEAQKELERKSLEEKGEYSRILEQVNGEHAKIVETKDKALSEKDAEIASLRDQINRLSIGNSFGQSSFIADELVLTPAKVEALYGHHFDVQDGKVVAFDKPRGQPDRTPLVDAKGSHLPFEDALKKIVMADPDFERMKRSSLKKGAESDTDNKAKEGADNGVFGLGRIKSALEAKK